MDCAPEIRRQLNIRLFLTCVILSMSAPLFSQDAPLNAAGGPPDAAVRLNVRAADRTSESLIGVVSSSLEIFLNLNDIAVLTSAGADHRRLTLNAEVGSVDGDVHIEISLVDEATGMAISRKSDRDPIGPNLDRAIATLAAAVFDGVDLSRVDAAVAADSPSAAGPEPGPRAQERVAAAPAAPAAREGATPAGRPSDERREAPVSQQPAGERSASPAENRPADARVAQVPPPAAPPAAPPGDALPPHRRTLSVSTTFAPMFPIAGAARYVGTGYGGSVAISVAAADRSGFSIGLQTRVVASEATGVAAHANLTLVPFALAIGVASAPAPFRPSVRVFGGGSFVRISDDVLGTYSKLVPYVGAELAAVVTVSSRLQVELVAGLEGHFEGSLFILAFSPGLGVVVAI